MENKHLDGYLFDPSKYNDSKLMEAAGCTCRQCENRERIKGRDFCKAHKSNMTKCKMLRIKLNQHACYKFINKAKK